MKKYVVFIFCLILSLLVFGQNTNKSMEGDKNVIQPEFNGISEALFKGKSNSYGITDYLNSKIVYPKEAVKCCVEGTEIVQFVVTSEGNVTDINCVNSVCGEIDNEVIRILKNTNGMWKPGTENGYPVAMKQEIAFAFCVQRAGIESMLEYFTTAATDYFNKGNKKLFEAQNPKRALEYYDLAMRYLPNDKAILYVRGLAKYESGDKEGARQDWERIKKLAENGRIENNVELTAANYKNLKGYGELASMFKE